MTHVHTPSFPRPIDSPSSRHRVGPTPRRAGLFRISVSAASDKSLEQRHLGGPLGRVLGREPCGEQRDGSTARH